MTSDLKSATARANGAKSRGPKTPETREISSRNSLTHGFTARKTIVLECESDDAYHEMLDHYAAIYLPGSPVEQDLVNEMVAARWRMQRLRMIEAALLDSEMNREEPETETQPPPTDPGYQLAFAFRRVADESRAISLASRYESRLHRMHERCHRTLRELQHERRKQTAEPIPPALVQPEPPPPTVEQPLPSHSDKKSQNEPTPIGPAAARKHRQHLPVVRHRPFRQLKTA
jgi:hypothetical protein